MKSALFWSSFLLVVLTHRSFIKGAPSQCPETDLIMDGGTYSLNNMYNEGSILKYTCPEGFYPYPVKKRVCDSGLWDPSPSTEKTRMCKRVTCPNPNVLENGNVRPSQRLYYVNDKTDYTCHSGYTFRGSSTRVCLPNGKWSGGTPICSHNTDHCPDPGIPPGATREGHIFNIDDKVTYTCAKNLKLIGSKVRVCQDGGYWSGTKPECYADFTYDTPEEVAEAFGSSLQTTVTMYEESGKEGKRIRLEKGGKLDIYIALDASDSIDEKDFNKAKEVIKKLITKISYYEVFPNYEIIIFATDVTKIVEITDYKKPNPAKLKDTLALLDKYKYDSKGDKTGTNIRNAYEAIEKSMSFEKAQNKTAFDETQHVIIMFTDGIVNMGGNPKLAVDKIRSTVYGDDKKREKYLDLYAFGVGSDIEREKINEWVTKRDNGDKYFFILPNMDKVGKTLDDMIDESTSMTLCGLYKDYIDSEYPEYRRTYPWLIKISVTHDEGTSSCIGSLVTPRFILTAAHCFRFDDDPDRFLLIPTGLRDVKLKAEEYFPHPKYDNTNKMKDAKKENYEYDVALIKLTKSVTITPDIRTICIPCTQETNGALQLSASDATCAKHREVLLDSDLVKAHFISHHVEQDQEVSPKKHVIIKQGQQRHQCYTQAAKVLGLSDVSEAEKKITDSFLCTGGASEKFIDDTTCKGDSGGPTVLEKNRLIQVGVISWGLKDLCKVGGEPSETRDFQTNLFIPEVQDFLKQYLGNDSYDTPLHFL